MNEKDGALKASNNFNRKQQENKNIQMFNKQLHERKLVLTDRGKEQHFLYR